MNIDIVTVEIGSTITKINAWDGIKNGQKPVHMGQSSSLTTVNEKDVNIGVQKALSDLEKKLGKSINVSEFLINSSAAGGLKIAVFGLTYDMTVRAAKEASLGAGSIIKYIGVGKIMPFQLEELEESKPGIIILSGGVDFGETEITYHNAEILSSKGPDVPYIYAGNKKIASPVKKLFQKHNKKIIVTDNVYPNIDELNIEGCKEIIQHTFSEHIIHASGMEKLNILTSREIIPTPYAVMKTAQYINKVLGNVVIIDVGGATSDVHSVCEDSTENNVKRIEPEPLAKRTVEGDLGVFINASNLNEIKHKFYTEKINLSLLKPLPDSQESLKITRYLAEKAVTIAIARHAGKKKILYTPNGKKEMIQGKDLTQTDFIIGTGGALTRIPEATSIIEKVKGMESLESLLPSAKAICAVDNKYIFSSIGTILFHYPNIDIKELIIESIKKE
ncbi:MAG: glutamate mutase L [Candidatus Muiribacteriota bacterium]